MNLLTLNLESLFPDVYKEIHFDNFSVQITENNLQDDTVMETLKRERKQH